MINKFISPINVFRKNKLMEQGFILRFTKRALGWLVLLFMYPIGANAQSETLTLELKNTSIEEVFNRIESLSGYTFIYNSDIIDLDRKINISAQNKSINVLLNEILNSTDVEFSFADKRIILKSRSVASTQTSQTISGKITDNQGNGLPSSIIVKGTNIGVVANIDGSYSINVPASIKNPVLLFVSMGYAEQELAVEGKGVINVVLNDELSKLNEVVVVGYGTMDKREVTSSITSIKTKDMMTSVSSNPLMGVQGKVAGLNIASSNGNDPNSTISLQLRGANSVKAGQGPLVVIDGIPGADLQSVAPGDIKSIDVLKDASAAAIYGTRGSGGVILVTTNQASEGPLTVSYTGELITETVRKYAKPLSTEAYLAAGLGTNFGHSTNWFEEITQTPISQKHSVTLSGGSKSTKVYSSFFYRDLDAIVIGSDRKELGGRINLNFTGLDGLLDVITHSSYSQQKGNYVNNDVFRQAVLLNPTQTAYDANDVTGYNIWTGGWEEYNPLARIKLETDQKKFTYFLSDAMVRLNLSKDLNTSAMFGVKNTSEHDVFWKSAQHRDSRADRIDGEAKQEQKEWSEFTFEYLINYSKRIGDHSFKLLGGYSYQKFDHQLFHAKNKNFPVDGVKWYDMGSGTFLSDGRAEMGSKRDPTEKIAAGFSRLNYSYDNKYLLMASIRYEGSSKFHKSKRWGMFPAISLGWRINSESFMEELTFIDDLKLRVGYGKTGNQDFGTGRYTRQYSADGWWLYNGKWIKPYGLDFNTNEDLSWETKTEFNIGLDFSLLKNKLSGKIDVYRRNSDNLIYDISVSQPPAVHDKTTMNSGSLTNTGWEMELSWNAIAKKDFQFTSSIRASSNKNVLKSLWGSQTYWDKKGFPSPGSPGDAVRLYPGEEIGRFYIWDFAGFTDDGQWQLYNKNGEVINANLKTNDDKKFFGNAIPRLILSWDNSFHYKNFDLDIYLRSWINYDVFNMLEMYYGIPIGQNVLEATYEKNKHIKNEKQMSNYFLEDGTFLKVDAITLGYRFDVSKVKHIKNLRVYLTGRNLFTITGYKGLDPEVDINGLEPGFEARDVYPKTRVFTFGCQLTF